MNKQTLQDFYFDLLKTLWVDFVFYIPSNSAFSEELQKLPSFKNQRLIDTVMVVDYHKGPIKLLAERDNTKIVLKNAALEQNTFGLIAKKRELSTVEFNYISSKYLEQIKTVAYITDWLANNLHKHIKYNQYTSGLFNLQQTNYKAHYHSFLEHFSSEKVSLQSNNGHLKLEHLINSHYKDLKNVILKKTESLVPDWNSTQGTTSKKLPNNTNATTKTEKTIKKTPLIMQKDAEKSILKHVFKLDI